MPGLFGTGLNVRQAGRAPAGAVALAPTDEAAVTAHSAEDLRVDLLADEGSLVAQGAPLLRLRRAPGIVLTAPMAGRVASVDLGPGRRLAQVVLFAEGGERFRHLPEGEGEAAQRALMQGAGLWRGLRRRPFGGMPEPGERPAAIFVMAADTRPGAPDPLLALEGREEDLGRGLAALTRMTDGPVWQCQPPGPPLAEPGGQVRLARVPALHPAGLAGMQVHALCPARPDAPVWDIHAEDVADLGTLLATGYLPETRLVSVAGAALREARLVRAQPGADLRGLVHGHALPGTHLLLSGSPLEGREARWLAPRERLATALPRAHAGQRPHWFRAALSSASRPLPVIPTAALDQALGGLPAAPLVRALAAGDAETAVRLGALSLLEEDLALADYVTCAEPRLSGQLRVLLDRIRAEEGG